MRHGSRPLVLCLVLTLAPGSGWAATLGAIQNNASVGAAEDPVPPPPEPLPREIAEDAEVFRQQVLRLLDEIEAVTEEALALSSGLGAPSTHAASNPDHPVVQLSDFNLRLERSRHDVLQLDDDELQAMRDEFEQFPDILTVPLQLEASLASALGPANQTAAAEDECAGGDNTDEAIFVTKIIKHSLTIIMHPVETAANIIDSSPGDPTHASAIACVVLYAVKLALELLVDAADLTVTIMERVKQKRDECLAGLCKPDPDPLGPGKGCDGVDTDCDDPTDVDETAEDQYSPDVVIERSVGNVCYATIGAAAVAVKRFTRVTDDCSATVAEEPSAELVGCDLFVGAAAADLTGNIGADAVQLVVDGSPPTLTCSVATSSLSPADNAMYDVGLSIDATDNCGVVPELRLEVTSDEPTATAIPGVDPAPDAVVLYDAEQRPSGVLLRAQRNGAPGSNGGGRVYRIRAIATDGCGLESQADCLVLVGIAPGSTTAVNSGQLFDATTVN